jgi:hypothetical protein
VRSARLIATAVPSRRAYALSVIRSFASVDESESHAFQVPPSETASARAWQKASAPAKPPILPVVVVEVTNTRRAWTQPLRSKPHEPSQPSVPTRTTPGSVEDREEQVVTPKSAPSHCSPATLIALSPQVGMSCVPAMIAAVCAACAAMYAFIGAVGRLDLPPRGELCGRPAHRGHARVPRLRGRPAGAGDGRRGVRPLPRRRRRLAGGPAAFVPQPGAGAGGGV